MTHSPADPREQGWRGAGQGCWGVAGGPWARGLRSDPQAGGRHPCGLCTHSLSSSENFATV